MAGTYPNETRCYTCTRPRIASYLMSLGYAARIQPHPWRPNLTAWVFDVDHDLALIVSKCYAQQDCTPPAVITEQLLEDEAAESGQRDGDE